MNKNKILFCIVMFFDIIGSISLTYLARHSISPEWNYYVFGIICLIALSVMLGPGMIIGCLAGIIIGFII